MIQKTCKILVLFVLSMHEIIQSNEFLSSLNTDSNKTGIAIATQTVTPGGGAMSFGSDTKVNSGIDINSPIILFLPDQLSSIKVRLIDNKGAYLEFPFTITYNQSGINNENLAIIDQQTLNSGLYVYPMITVGDDHNSYNFKVNIANSNSIILTETFNAPSKSAGVFYYNITQVQVIIANDTLTMYNTNFIKLGTKNPLFIIKTIKESDAIKLGIKKRIEMEAATKSGKKAATKSGKNTSQSTNSGL